MTELANLLTPTAEEYEHIDNPADKRQVLKEALQKGKGHLLPKKCTEGFIDKAPDEAIDKVHADFIQKELCEKGEKTAKALTTHVVSLYANLVGNFVNLDSVEDLKNDINNDPIIKDAFADLGILVYCTFGRCLAPILLAGHTSRHITNKKVNTEEKEPEVQTPQ